VCVCSFKGVIRLEIELKGRVDSRNKKPIELDRENLNIAYSLLRQQELLLEVVGRQCACELFRSLVAHPIQVDR
jgi:hypothetical protein